MTPQEIWRSQPKKWAFLELEAGKKKPVPGSHGWKSATKLPSKIAKFAPESNIGIAMGDKSGIFSIDVDGMEGRATLELLKKQLGPLPKTPCFKTPNGYQFLYKIPEGSYCQSVIHYDGGIDILGDKRYCVAPGSKVGEKEYYWIVSPAESEAAELPDSWISYLGGSIKDRKKKGELRKVKYPELPHLKGDDANLWKSIAKTVPTGPGTRNQCLLALCRTLARFFPKDTDPEELRGIVSYWHKNAQAAGSKTSERANWKEFQNAWRLTKWSHNSLARWFDKAQWIKTPKGVWGQSDQVKLTARLIMAANGELFLGVRELARLLKTNKNKAHKILKTLKEIGFIKETEKGNWKTGRSSSFSIINKAKLEHTLVDRITCVPKREPGTRFYGLNNQISSRRCSRQPSGTPPDS